ncbi:MAG: NDP-sugar synthase [Lachnospiraceae bacterium]
MKDATLVIMAAGIGSRFGGGIKQLESVGPNGEIIMDYSIYDAMEAGFNKVVFVIRKSLEKDFKDIIGNRIEKIVNVVYAYQELDDIPEEFETKLLNRKKPWGTGQAILACKDVVNEPFLVINADDYYGKEAYHKAYEYLTSMSNKDMLLSKSMDMCMVGFVLKNTLSKNGTVTRGICEVGENHMLKNIEETYEIEEKDGYATAVREGKKVILPLDSPVSMNMWGLPIDFFDVLEEGFVQFLKELEEEDIKKEYLLPQIIGQMLREGEANVHVLSSSDNWFGVTYKEDKDTVVEEIRSLISSGMYPETLY